MWFPVDGIWWLVDRRRAKAQDAKAAERQVRARVAARRLRVVAA